MSSETDGAIVILGASFAGVEVVYQLVRAFDGKPPPLIVVDRQSEHGYLPLVQERLCGVLDPAESRLNTRAFVESVPQARYVQGEVESFDPATKTVKLANGTSESGRFAVVALGSGFEAPAGIDGAQNVLGYKGEADFTRAHEALRGLLEGAEDRPEIVVVGGGISGCELAGELAALAGTRPTGWSAPKVRLATSAAALVDSMGAGISSRATRALEAQGVSIDVSSRVLRVADGEAHLESAGATKTVRADLVLWAGGIRPAPILEQLGLPRTDDGWLSVGPTLQCFAEPEMTKPDIFACGDAVRVRGGDGEWPTMQRAIECIWQAKVVARNIAELHEQPTDYDEGVPPLQPHKLRSEFFYGLSLGARSMVLYRGMGLDMPGINHRFRRWLMRQYFARYAPLPG
ncbi:MAG: NAD(P)/FAD-dependent oxidoreductase [Nannocystales bacterium]